MRGLVAGSVAVLVIVVGVSAATAAPARARQRVTFIGDSVPAGLNYVPQARRYLGRGFSVYYDLKVCRRLVYTSCTYQGVTPPSALQVISSLGRSLAGQIVIIDVGYNEDSSRYRADLNTIMRTLVRLGVKKVIWVTLREQRSYYRSINAIIRSSPRRWRHRMRVADWQYWSRSHPSWFGGDGLHLNSAGAMGLARLLRKHVLASL